MTLLLEVVGSSAVRLLPEKIDNPQQCLSPQSVPFEVLRGETHVVLGC
jgi:hypothetical protein